MSDQAPGTPRYGESDPDDGTRADLPAAGPTRPSAAASEPAPPPSRPWGGAAPPQRWLVPLATGLIGLILGIAIGAASFGLATVVSRRVHDGPGVGAHPGRHWQDNRPRPQGPLFPGRPLPQAPPQLPPQLPTQIPSPTPS